MNLDNDSDTYDDASFDDTIDCPHCGASIYDDVSQCPECREYISSSDFKNRKRIPNWIWVLVVLMTVFAFSLPYLQTVWRMTAEP